MRHYISTASIGQAARRSFILGSCLSAVGRPTSRQLECLLCCREDFTVARCNTYGEDAEQHRVILRTGPAGAAGAHRRLHDPGEHPNPASAILRFAVIR